jgi:hypothetical protein
VPGLPVFVPPELPQPATIDPTKTNSDASTTAGRRFRIGAKHSIITINAVAAAPVPTIQRVVGRMSFVGTNGILEAAVVLTVRVAVPVVVLADKLIGPPTEHVGGSFPVNGDTLQESATAPINPPVPVAVIVDVPDWPGAAIVTAVDANVKVPGVVTVTVTGVVTTVAPLVPVTVTV